MRAISDFLSGIISGVRSRTRSCTKRERRATTTADSPGLSEVLIRGCILVLAVAVGAVALFAASGQPERKTNVAMKDGVPTAQPPVVQANLDDVLATDPAAAKHLWKYIVLHHSASPRGSAQIFDQYHREKRGWQCLGYHFVIGNGTDQGDGLIIAGPRWYAQEGGAHANSIEYNEHGIGICLVGNFDDKGPTPAQVAATRELLKRLCRDHKLTVESVVGHNQIRRGGSTACPGKNFPLNELREGLESRN